MVGEPTADDLGVTTSAAPYENAALRSILTIGESSTMTLEDYWKQLDAVGWLDGRSDGQRRELRRRLEEAYARADEDASPIDLVHALADLEFDPECVEGEGDYASIVERYARASRGKFAPTSVADHVDHDRSVAEVAFEFAGRRFECKVACDTEWFDERVHDLINEALATAKVPERFIALPAIGQFAHIAFTRESAYQAALERSLIVEHDEAS
jgi:hypothetical protein